MILIYDIGIWFYKTAIHLAAFFGNEKARLWVNGRKHIFEKIEAELNNSKLKTQNSKLVWMHVASLGEFEQGRPIIEKLKQSPISNLQSPIIILTFFSPSGYEIRKNYPHADHIFYLPMDSRQNAKRFLDLVKPDVSIFVKYEFWWHYLSELHRRQILNLLVSAIFREKQFSKFSFYAKILRGSLNQFSKIFVQNHPSVKLLKSEGFQNVVYAGDTRVDRVAAIPTEAKRIELVEKFVGDAPVFIGGSTWEADEKVIVPIFENPKFADWKFIFAPHDISEKNIVRLQQLLPKNTIRFSELEKKQSPITNHQSLIIDNVGMLSALYRYGKVAFIGGGFGRGIHNTLEPIAFGLPVLFGQKYQKFAEAVSLVESGGGFTVTEAIDFQRVMEDLLVSENYQKASDAAADYITQNRGATDIVVAEIGKILV